MKTNFLRYYVTLLCVVFLLISGNSFAQKKNKYEKEKAEIKALIDKYNKTEDDCDFEEQAKIMSEDRVFCGTAGEGRAVDQSENMKFQKIHLNIVNQEVPGIIWHSEARNLLIKIYAEGEMAIASFHWLRAQYLPANTPDNIRARYPNPPARLVTLVFEKQKEGWKIVHTHMSMLYPDTSSH
jgi:ketosteroid isomerase-like protein